MHASEPVVLVLIVCVRAGTGARYVHQTARRPGVRTTTTIAVSAAIADVARAATAAVAQATEQFPLELDTVFLNTNIRLTMNLVIRLCKIPGSDAHAKLWFLFGNHLSWFSNGSHAMNFGKNYARKLF